MESRIITNNQTDAHNLTGARSWIKDWPLSPWQSDLPRRWQQHLANWQPPANPLTSPFTPG